MRKLTKILAVLALTVALGAGMTLSAQAYLIDFAVLGGVTSGSTNNISYAGGTNNPLIAQNLPVSSSSVIGGPDNSISIYDGLLNFTTGNSNGGWQFGGNTDDNAITITGSLSQGGPSLTLLHGYITGASLTQPLPGFPITIAITSFFDWKHEALLDALGISSYPDLFVGSLSIIFYGTGTFDGAMQSTLIASGNVLNSPVPIPPSALLFGSGILGMVAWGWRRGRKED